MHIIVKDDVMYIIEGMSEEVATELHEIIESIGKINLRLYFTIYRTFMGLPLDVSPEVERSMLEERFGKRLLDSKGFTSNIILAQKEYEAKKAILPDLIGWLVMEKGAKVTAADEIFYA